MGVQGLWQLLESTGRPVTLESLENKVLAVDVSIWLNQAVRGCRDRQGGGPMHNAHLLTLFSRICKLLFYKIKPVFVFDGGVPILKKQTLAARRKRKELAAKEAHQTSQKLLMNLIRRHAVQTRLAGESDESASSSRLVVNSTKTKRESDLFELPPLPNEEVTRSANTSDEDEEDDEWPHEHRYLHHQNEFQILDTLDVNSEAFRNLPSQIQHELLSELKETRKKNSWARLDEMPQESQIFSTFQMARLLKRRSLQQRLEEVQQDMLEEMSGQAMMHFGNGCDYAGKTAAARRIMSDDNAHYILIKGRNTNASLIDKSSNELLNKPTRTTTSVKQTFVDEVPTTSASNSGVEIMTEDEAQKNHDLVPGDVSGEDSLETIEFLQQVTEKATHKMNNSAEEQTSLDELRTLIPDFTDIAESRASDAETTHVVCNISPGGLKTTERDKVSSPQFTDCTNKRLVTEIEVQMNPNENHKAVVSSDDSIVHKSFVRTVEQEGVVRSKLGGREELLPTEADYQLDEAASSSSESDDFVEVETPVEAEWSDLFPAEIFTKPNATDRVVQPGSSKNMEKITIEEEDDDDDVVTISETKINLLDEAEEPAPDNGELSSLSTVELQQLNEDLHQEEQELVNEKNKQERIAASISDQMYAESQDLLRLFGVPYVVSPMEAEAQCATLDSLDLTDGTITDDSDIWLFGGQTVYKNMFNQNKHVEFYKSSDIGSMLGLDRQKLISVALLTGSDYTDGIEAVGYVTAMEILGEFPGKGIGSLSKLKNWWDAAQNQSDIQEGTKVKQKLCKLVLHSGFPNESVFNAYLQPTVDESTEKFSWAVPDLDALRDFAQTKFGWTTARSDDVLLPVMKRCNSRTNQTKLDSYFKVTLEKEPSRLPSKRLVRAMKKCSKNASFVNEEDARSRAVEILNKKTGRRRKMETGEKTINCASGSLVTVENLSVVAAKKRKTTFVGKTKNSTSRTSRCQQKTKSRDSRTQALGAKTKVPLLSEDSSSQED